MVKNIRLQQSHVARLIAYRKALPPRLVIVNHTNKKRSEEARGDSTKGEDDAGWRSVTLSKFLEGAATALGSILVLGLAGFSYQWYYKSLVLTKIENAFAPGYSSLELAAMRRQSPDPTTTTKTPGGSKGVAADEEPVWWVDRKEQDIIDGIVDGSIRGHYHLISGEKGTGKTSMILKAMRRNDGEGVAMFEAHGDLEVFRTRLGKAIDYEFHEDYAGSLFSFKGPRDTSALLDIERAFNKMEKVALDRQRRLGRPLVLIINGVHLLRDNEEGGHLMELIQQRAELWAASSLVTVVLCSDEYWTTERLMWQATRLQIHPVHDIGREAAVRVLRDFRSRAFGETVPDRTLDAVFGTVGGRLRFLAQVARSPDMLAACDAIVERERRWFLSQCWIFGQAMDDGAEEQQEPCAAAMTLARELVARDGDARDGRLPRIPLHEARQLMTRADWIREHDRLNVFTIDSDAMVQADSVAMQNAFVKVVAEPGFERLLRETTTRLDELEGLGRTRELVLKDLVGGKEVQATLERVRSEGGDADKGGQKKLVLSVGLKGG